MFEKYLEEIGLSDKEAKVYVALLQVDHDSVLDLSKRTSINRTTIYPVIESLAKKGLVSEIQIDKKIHIKAEPPERLETYVERRKLNFEEQAKRLKDIVPQLKSIQRESGERPVVKYFEGINGILSSSDELYSYFDNSNELNYLIYPRDLVEELFSDVREKFIKQRRDKKINIKALYTRKAGDLPEVSDSYRLRIDDEKYPILCDIAIYGENVRINTLSSQISSILIKSKDLAITLKSLVDLVFDLQNKK
jgi:sugar-specific transcriptional regulator TrmB